jgi:uncharacterized protein with WD repeat
MRGAKLLGIGAAIAILLVAAGNSGQVGLSQGQIPPVRTLGLYGVSSVVFSPDGRYLAVGTAGGSSVQLIDTSSWQVIRTFEGHTDTVNSVAFSPDGRLLASGSSDKTIKLWEVATGSEVRTLTGHTGWVNSVAFSPTGGCWPPAPRRHDQAVGGGQWPPRAHPLRPHRRCLFRGVQPDGRLLASGSMTDDQAVGHQRSGGEVRSSDQRSAVREGCEVMPVCLRPSCSLKLAC